MHARLLSSPMHTWRFNCLSITCDNRLGWGDDSANVIESASWEETLIPVVSFSISYCKLQICVYFRNRLGVVVIVLRLCAAVHLSVVVC